MNSFFEYLDYRELLKNLFEERKLQDSWFSYRWLSKRIDVASTGFLSLVLCGKRNISSDVAQKICSALKFTKKEASYFVTLVRYNHATNAEGKERAYEDLLASRPASAKSLRSDQHEFYNRWYYSAIRELVSITKVTDNHKRLAECLIPKITINEVRDALILLERLNLIYKNNDGVYKRVERLITAAGSIIEPAAIRKYQSETMELARTALYKIAKEKRDISTVTLSTNESGLAMIKKRIEQCRSEIMAIANQSMCPDRIVQLNMQLFPLCNEWSDEQ
jgi:uncharacterized protein (TIGR02147 family)